MQKDARNPSKSQAEIHNIKSVEPFGIVYAAVLVRCFLLVLFLSQSFQTRQALSSTSWGPKDLHFDYKVFTEQLFSLFKDGNNPWVKKLLSWWNRCVIDRFLRIIVH
jgi:phage-related minor tail protein